MIATKPILAGGSDGALGLHYSWKVWAVCATALVLVLVLEAASRWFR